MKRYILLLLMVGVSTTAIYAKLFNRTEYVIEITDSTRVAGLIDSSRVLLYQDSGQALQVALNAYALAKEADLEKLEAMALLAIGNVHVFGGNFSEAVKNIEEGISVFREMGAKRELASALVSLGNAYKTQSDYRRAISYYLQSLKVCKELDLKRGISANLGNIGLVYNEMEEYTKAEEYYLQAVKINKEMGYEYLLAINYNNLGLLYTSLKKRDLALMYHRKSRVLKAKAGNKIGEAYSLNNIGKLYLESGKLDSAEHYIIRALEFNRVQDPDLSAISYELLARIYFQKNRADLALEHAQKSLQLAEEVGSLFGIQEAHRIISDIYENSGDHKLALEHTKAFLAIKDSLTGIEKARQISSLQSRFEQEQKQREIDILELENANRKITQIALMSGLVLLLMIGFLGYQRQRNKIKQREVDLYNSRLKQKELEQDLEFKNKRLTTQSLNLVQKNEMMMELRQQLQELRKKGMGGALNSLSYMVDYSFNLDKDWEQFQMYFEEVHSGFYQVLKERYPDMTLNDMKLCALVKLSLTIKEMATILGISPDSVKTARYRLRKKLGLETDQNLTEFMLVLEKEAGNLS